MLDRFAFYALVFGLLYVVGFPLGIMVILFKHRTTLFGDAAVNPHVAATRAKYGFLYEVYGPTAWWWEVEELVRKLLLSAVVVLIEPGSPLQVRLYAWDKGGRGGRGGGAVSLPKRNAWNSCESQS